VVSVVAGITNLRSTNVRRIAATRSAISAPPGPPAASLVSAASAHSPGGTGFGRRLRTHTTISSTTPTGPRANTQAGTGSGGGRMMGGTSSGGVTGRAAVGIASVTVRVTVTETAGHVTFAPFTVTGLKLTTSGVPSVYGSSRYTCCHRSRPFAAGVTAAEPSGRMRQPVSASAVRSCFGSSMRSGAGPSIVSVTRTVPESVIRSRSAFASAVTPIGCAREELAKHRARTTPASPPIPASGGRKPPEAPKCGHANTERANTEYTTAKGMNARCTNAQRNAGR